MSIFSMRFIRISSLLLSIAFIAPYVYSQDNGMSSYNIIIQRNIFRPLWAVTSPAGNDDKSKKAELETLRKAEEERQKSQQITELANKKHEIESTYTLNGIVFENGKKQAIIQVKKGSTHFAFENDMLDDLKITSINDSKSEVTADYQGKFTVTFHME